MNRLAIVASMLALSSAPLSSAALAMPKTPSPRPQAEVDRALQEFRSAAERLGKSMAKVADENTVEIREKLMRTMSDVMLELSQTLNDATTSLEGRKSPKPRPKPSPALPSIPTTGGT